MIHAHSLGRASRYYPERTALASGVRRSTFRELHDRVAGIAAALSKSGFGVGDRLALLLPNEPEYIELVHACAWLGVIAVPLNTRPKPLPASPVTSLGLRLHSRFIGCWTARRR
jgi:acyl-CoA synthetase (AMP-forming)/AMP-acid ligase II